MSPLDCGLLVAAVLLVAGNVVVDVEAVVAVLLPAFALEDDVSVLVVAAVDVPLLALVVVLVVDVVIAEDELVFVEVVAAAGDELPLKIVLGQVQSQGGQKDGLQIST